MERMEDCQIYEEGLADVLILRVLEGLTAEEACAVLKIKSTVCCTRLYRAKAELQKRVLRAKLFDI